MIATVRLGAALGVLALLALGCGDPQAERVARSGGSTSPADHASPKDAAIRNFSVTSFSGKEFTLSAQLGSPVVLNFFESW